MGANVSADSAPLKWSEILLYSDGCPTSPSGSPAGAAHQLYHGAESNIKAWCLSSLKGGDPTRISCEGVSLTGETSVGIDPKNCYVVLYLTRKSPSLIGTPPAQPLPTTPPARSVPASFVSAFKALKETITPRGPNHPFSLDSLFPGTSVPATPGMTSFAERREGARAIGVNAVVYVLSGQQATGMLKANTLIHGMQLQGWLTDHPHLSFGLYTACSKTGIASRFYNSGGASSRPPLSAELKGTPRNTGSRLNSPVGLKGLLEVPHMIASLMGEDMVAAASKLQGVQQRSVFGGAMLEPACMPTSPTDDADQAQPFDEFSEDTMTITSASQSFYPAGTPQFRGSISLAGSELFSKGKHLSAGGTPLTPLVGKLWDTNADTAKCMQLDTTLSQPPHSRLSPHQLEPEDEDFEDEKVMEQRAREKLMKWSPQCSTVLPCLCVGGEMPANDLETLLEGQVTHVLNTVNMLVDNGFPEHFTYFPINMMDSINEDISVVFPHVIACIEEVRQKPPLSLPPCLQVTEMCWRCIVLPLFFASCERRNRRSKVAKQQGTEGKSCDGILGSIP
eukprot:TRINITY_DN4713_c0_g1_i2.p1 TRINITY_DN4713_c0_g1~~TRINITY_DN4713_c0_g1_i2.p1  ORF type:complete len:564 (+),score=182.55 TRINITY_DN4713_c0_g1_i2:75-1766(+)